MIHLGKKLTKHMHVDENYSETLLRKIKEDL